MGIRLHDTKKRILEEQVVIRRHLVNIWIRKKIHKTDASEKLHNMKQQKTYYSKKQFMQGGKYVFIY